MTLNNKIIFEYYAANPHLNFEAINLNIIGLLDQMQSDHTKIITQNQTTEILECVRNLNHKSDHQAFQLKTLQQHGDNVLTKLHEYNHTFVDNVKVCLANNTNQEIKQVTDTFVDKIARLLPQTTTEPLQRSLTDFQFQLFREMDKLQQNAGSQREDLETTLVRLQQPIFMSLTETQHQINRLKSDNELSLVPLAKSLAANQDQMQKIMDENRVTTGVLEKVNNGFMEFTGKYKDSSQFKGQASENYLEQILTQFYPTAFIRMTRTVRASGDMILEREEEGKPRILFENKNYSRNVRLEETRKFLRDVTEQHCSGIMLSQFSGIVGKPDGFIEINDGHVLVYLHNVDANAMKIQMAVNVVDQLAGKLATLNKDADNDVTIDKAVLDSINHQFTTFLKMKELIISTAKDYHRKLVGQLDDLQMPNLALFLQDKYASVLPPTKPAKRDDHSMLEMTVDTQEREGGDGLTDVSKRVADFILNTYGQYFEHVDRHEAFVNYTSNHDSAMKNKPFLKALRAANIELYPKLTQKYMRRSSKRICFAPTTTNSNNPLSSMDEDDNDEES